MAEKDKIQLVHPEGKNAPRISTKTYNLFRKAIIEVLNKQTGITLSEIAEGVHAYIRNNAPEFNGSVEWFTVSVKQHLESEKVIEAYIEKGRKLHRLVQL